MKEDEWIFVGFLMTFSLLDVGGKTWSGSFEGVVMLRSKGDTSVGCVGKEAIAVGFNYTSL